MKNLKKGPLSINAISTLKMVVSLLFALALNVGNAQPLTLVKDINTPQSANLAYALVYAAGNKIYLTDGTANGTRLIYTGAANAIISLTNGNASYINPIATFFVERTTTTAKTLRYNKVRVEVLSEGTTITYFAENSGLLRYVVNGNQLYKATANTGPTLIKTFSTPIKEIKDNVLFTTNSVWLIDFSLGTATLAKDGLTEIGETNGFLFAANDGGFNGTELWTTQSPATAYLVKDLNPGTASSNPRNFFSNNFTATSEGQNWIYSFDYVNPKRILPAPIGTELKTLSFTYGASQYGQYVSFTIYSEKIGSNFTIYAAQTDTPSIKRVIYSGTEGEVVFNSTVSGIFTHNHSNGTRDIWQFVNSNPAQLIVPNASLDNQYSGFRYVAGDDGKFWRMDFDQNTQRFNRFLIKDFGAAKLQVQGTVYVSTTTTSRSEFVLTSTLNGVVTTNVLDLSVQDPTNIRAVATVTPSPNDYSSFPNSFVEINGKILFKAYDGENGEELWRTDGTTAGTSLFKAFTEGPYGNVGKSLKDNGFVYYENASNFTNSITYWKTDGATIDSIRSTTAEYQNIRNRFNAGTIYPSLTVGTAKYQSYYASYSLC